MRVLLVNPPNCGRSVLRESYGVDSIEQIFRGEPLALEALAGNLTGHDVQILDLKVAPAASFEKVLADFCPRVVGFTAMTCEAGVVRDLAGLAHAAGDIRTVVGGIHASADPVFFNVPEIDYIVCGLGKATLPALLAWIDGRGAFPEANVAVTCPGQALKVRRRPATVADLAENAPPRYDLTAPWREHYRVEALGLNMGFVSTAFGCPHQCAFCCVPALTGGRYLAHSARSITRDIGLLDAIPVVRLVDANTFGDARAAAHLADAIAAAGLEKQYLADARADTIARHPDLFRRWRDIGLRAVVIGFEDAQPARLQAMRKGADLAEYDRAIEVLHDLGVTIVGDFIINPDYTERDFEAVEAYLQSRAIDLPILSIMTPLPGTELFRQMANKIVIRDLAYYTLTNAVVETRLPGREFYQRYAALTSRAHAGSNEKL